MDPLDALQRAVDLSSARLALVAALHRDDPPTVKLELQAAETAGRLARAAIDAGLAERRARIAEAQAIAIAAAFEQAVHRVLGTLPPDARLRLVEEFSERLAALESSGAA